MDPWISTTDSFTPESPLQLEPPDLEADRELVKRLLDADQDAFDMLASRHLRGLYRFAARRLDGDPELTAEIVQRTLVKVFAKLSTYRGEGTFFGWLCACCRNEILMHFRSRRGRPVSLGFDEKGVAPDALVTSADAPDRELMRAETAERVHVALDLLPDHYARALEWKYTEGLSVREIASRLDLGEKATESLLTRAREKFKDRYREVSEMQNHEVEKGSS